MSARVAEIRQDAVAHVFRDKAVVMPDRRAAPVLIRLCDHVAQIFGVHPGGECGRPHQVAEHHGQLAALGVRNRGEHGRGDRSGQNGRQGDRRGSRKSRLAAGVVGSAMGSGRAARPSAAKTRNSPSRSVAMCNAPINTRRTERRSKLQSSARRRTWRRVCRHWRSRTRSSSARRRGRCSAIISTSRIWGPMS